MPRPVDGIEIEWVDAEQQALLWGVTPEPPPRFDPVVVRLGIASLLLVNAVAALVSPETFRDMLSTNLVAGEFSPGVIDALVVFAAINDFVLAALVVAGRWSRLIYAWVALWFCTIAVVKLMNLVGL